MDAWMDPIPVQLQKWNILSTASVTTIDPKARKEIFEC